MNKETKNISYFEAQKILGKLRYIPRREWSKSEKKVFKICNFNVLSRKRLNKILTNLKSFGKLNNKSHYTYYDEDIRLIKDMILENLEQILRKFSRNTSILKESDLEKMQEHFTLQQQENIRLKNENLRLQNELDEYRRVKGLGEIDTFKKILESTITSNSKGKKNKLDQENNTKFRSISEKSLKTAISNWKEGMTLSEIKNEFLKENINLINTKKRKIKL